MALDEDGDGVDAICQDDYIVTSQTELEEYHIALKSQEISPSKTLM